MNLNCLLIQAEQAQVPVYLLDGGPDRQLPEHVLVEEPLCSDEVEQQLAMMDLPRHVYILPGTGHAFCVPITWTASPYTHTVVYYPLEYNDKDEIIVHSSKFEPSEIGHMKTLHSFGFGRAVIIEAHTVRVGLQLVQYHNNTPSMEMPSTRKRIMTSWPAPMPRVPFDRIFHPPCTNDKESEQTLDLGLSVHEIQEFFQSGAQVLCPWHAHLDLPEVIRAHLPSDCTPWEKDIDFAAFDRLLIYTDGSSKAKNRRKAPLRVQDEDVPDAWAFVVLGEIYGQQGEPSGNVFLGWHAQQVTYEEELCHFLGTDQIGSEFSEREALFWAAMWRFSINCTIPTLFRSDSVTTTDQALGKAGCADQHPTFHHLRCIFQALQATMPRECLDVSHVRGHAGDPWNEFADYLAKTEACIGHKLRRQRVNLKTFLPALPFMWMIFDERSGLPSFTGSGFDVSPPTLPSVQSHMPQERTVTNQSNMISLSIASFNVGSLFCQPDGYGGKIQYLRAQIQKMKLNVVGVQEARSPAGMTQADDFIRLASGSHQGRHGVELWINMTQPIVNSKLKSAQIKKQHLQVLHSDPRRLLVRLAHPFLNCHFLVLHAPQSGRPLQERRTWWEDTTQIVSRIAKDISLYVMIDANAKTGPSQPPVVFANDDAVSANTAFFCNFLRECDLCLPCTSDVHQGPDETWTAIDGKSMHRIDYVAIPRSELAACTLSRIVEEIEPGNCFDDHQAVAVQMQWTQQVLSSCSRAPAYEPFDRHSIRDKNASIDLTSLEVVEWHADIETQVQTLNSQVKGILKKACPNGRNRKKKACISSEVWQLRSAKLHLRRRLHQARKEQQKDSLRLMIWAWKADAATDDNSCSVVIDEHGRHANTVRCSIVHLNCRYYALARALKRAVQQSKQRHLNEEIGQINDKTAAGEILHRLRPFLGSSNPKKQKRPSLPCVRTADGDVCQTPIEAQKQMD